MKTVLIIEDNVELQQLYTEALVKKNIQVVCVQTAQKGLATMLQSKPDLLILDVMLPGGANGFDVLEQMKKDPRIADIPVFMVTNLDSEEQTARKIGVNEYIVKTSVSFEQIIEKITKFLA